jgi:2'-5' RNA ligase
MRAFISIEISNEDVLKRIQTFQEKLKISAKPTRIDQIHFTIKFLGEIDEEKCEKVKNVLKTITFSSFDLSLKGVGGFPNSNNPRVIWIGVGEGGRKLNDISNEIGQKLTTLGFEKDKKFKSHLTVFRIKKTNDISYVIKEHERMEFGTQIISKIKLKKSVLSPKGPEYSDLLEVDANEK